MSNLYENLGVNRKADKKTIKRAYREKARKLHPDIAGGSSEEFHRIQIAYDVLMDDAKRQRYDETGLFNRKRENTEEATIMLIQAVNQCLDNPSTPDFISAAVRKLKLEMQQLTEEINAYCDKAIRFREKASFVKKRTEGDNLIEAVLQQQAESADKIASNGRERLEVYRKAIRMGEDYSFEMPGMGSFKSLFQQPIIRVQQGSWGSCGEY